MEMNLSERNVTQVVDGSDTLIASTYCIIHVLQYQEESEERFWLKDTPFQQLSLQSS
jgi:hypothetical protein